MSEVPGYPVPQHGDAQPPGFFSMVHKRTFVLARMVAIGDNWGGCPFHMTCNALSRDVALISERVTPAGWMLAQFSGGSLGLKWKVPGDGVARTSDIPWKHMRKRQILARYGTAGFRTVADVLDPAAWLQETQVHPSSTQHRFLLASRFLHGLAGVVAVVAHTNQSLIPGTGEHMSISKHLRQPTSLFRCFPPVGFTGLEQMENSKQLNLKITRIKKQGGMCMP